MKRIRLNLMALVVLCLYSGWAEAGAIEDIQKAKITGGLIVQVGTATLELQELGEAFHVRILLQDGQAVSDAQGAIVQARLQGRFTVVEWSGGRLPFAERTLNALIVGDDGLVSESEAKRVLAPGGLWIGPDGSRIMPWPDTIDSNWAHYLYDATGNAVSKDREVGVPRSFRWWAEPRHLRSHNYSASFCGLVTANGRLFYLLDEGTYLFDKGGATPRWALIGRDAFNGAMLWKKPLEGYGQPYFEDVAGQAVRDYIWRTPLSMNRRVVAQEDQVFAVLRYREGPLSIIDAPTGQALFDVDLGGSVDEIIADEKIVICRVRSEIPEPADEMRGQNAWAIHKRMEQEGIEDPKDELRARVLDRLRQDQSERIVAVDPENGAILWQHDAPSVAVQSLAMADGKVVYHNYEALVALDAKTGRQAWSYPCPVTNRMGFMARNMLGNLLIADGKALWTSRNTGGAVCLDLADGKAVWTNPQLQTTGGFGFPTGQRVIGGVIYRDSLRIWETLRLADGSQAPLPNMGDMLKRGHHIRCIAGKATERYLLLPHRGAEYVDLMGDQHMVCDWFRGACSYGLMPANGMTYVTPDPCSCYAGSRIIGFFTLSAKLPVGLDGALGLEAPERLTKGPAYKESISNAPTNNLDENNWPIYMHDARRSSFAGTSLSRSLKVAWTRDLEGDLTQATIASDKAFIVRKDTYQLVCLNLMDGQIIWTCNFPAALDGPPTILGNLLFIGCRDGSVHCLRASDGEGVWRYLAAPLDRLTLDGGRLASLWPVSSSVMHHMGLIYFAAGRNSYLDGGIRLVALNPADGTVVHQAVLEGPWPDQESLNKGVVRGDAIWRMAPSDKRKSLIEQANNQYATGYHVEGGEADLLVTDGSDIYMAQNKFNPRLEQIDLQREWFTGYTPMGGLHMLANFGLLNDAMFHRVSRMYDDAWPSYGSGPGSAARSGSFVVVGDQRVYAAQHWESGGYASHEPGWGNRIVADNRDTQNLPGDMFGMEDRQKARELKTPTTQKAYVRTDEPLWTVGTPIIVRAMLGALDGQDQELIFAAGIAEGNSVEEWDQSTYYKGSGKLQVFAGDKGELLAEYELPACPVFDGLSAAKGRLIVPMVNGEIICFSASGGKQ